MTPTVSRLPWDQYFMRIAQVVASRSTCLRAQVGAVLVRNRSIVATGYNGAPAGMAHCTDVGCLLYKSEAPDGVVETNCFRTIHAEVNAIAQAARNGTSIDGADAYVTASPCVHCLKVLVNVGVRSIYYLRPYKIDRVREMLDQAGIAFVQVELPPDAPPETLPEGSPTGQVDGLS